MSSNRLDAITVLITRLQGIRKTNGFETDAGQRVFANEFPDLGKDDPDEAIAVVVGIDEPGRNGEKVIITLPVEVQAIVRVDMDSALDSWRAAETVLADVKRAVEVDRDLAGNVVQRGLERGPTRVLPRPEGATIVGIGITYRLVYGELWGSP